MNCSTPLYYEIRILFHDIEIYLENIRQTIDKIYEYQYDLSLELKKDHIDSDLLIKFTTLLNKGISEKLDAKIIRRIQRLIWRSIIHHDTCHCNPDESFGNKIPVKNPSLRNVSVYSVENIQDEIHQTLILIDERIRITTLRFDGYLRDTSSFTMKRKIVRTINKMTIRYMKHICHILRYILETLLLIIHQ